MRAVASGGRGCRRNLQCSRRPTIYRARDLGLACQTSATGLFTGKALWGLSVQMAAYIHIQLQIVEAGAVPKRIITCKCNSEVLQQLPKLFNMIQDMTLLGTYTDRLIPAFGGEKINHSIDTPQIVPTCHLLGLHHKRALRAWRLCALRCRQAFWNAM